MHSFTICLCVYFIHEVLAFYPGRRIQDFKTSFCSCLRISIYVCACMCVCCLSTHFARIKLSEITHTHTHIQTHAHTVLKTSPTTPHPTWHPSRPKRSPPERPYHQSVGLSLWLDQASARLTEAWPPIFLCKAPPRLLVCAISLCIWKRDLSILRAWFIHFESMISPIGIVVLRIHTYIHTYTNMHTCTHTHARIYAHIHIHTTDARVVSPTEVVLASIHT
jgi:hypothetical protein